MKKFLAMILILTFLFITGCKTVTTEEGSRGSADLSVSNTIASMGFADERTQDSGLNIHSSQTTVPSDNFMDETTLPVSSNSTSTQSTAVSATTSNSTENIDKDTGVPPQSSTFKSVAEMLDWIQSDEYADCTFKQTVRQLKLEQLLTIEPADDTFELEYINVRHTGSRIKYLFVNKKDERIHLNVDLPPMNLDANYLKSLYTITDRYAKIKYTTHPEIRADKEVSILGKSRKTYIRDYAQEAIVRETGKTTPVYALFLTDVDGYRIQGSLRGSWSRNNWDNKYLNYFQFSKQNISKK